MQKWNKTKTSKNFDSKGISKYDFIYIRKILDLADLSNLINGQ